MVCMCLGRLSDEIRCSGVAGLAVEVELDVLIPVLCAHWCQMSALRARTSADKAPSS